MKINREEHIHIWEVRASNPDQTGAFTYGYANVCQFIASRSMERTIELFRETYPEARLHKVERRNQVGTKLIIDPTLVE